MKVIPQINIVKVSVVFLLLLLELLLYYQYGHFFSIPVHILIYLFFIYWYISELKNNLTLTDKLIITSFVGPILSQASRYFINGVEMIIGDIIIFGIGHFFIIAAYHIEKPKIPLNRLNQTITKAIVLFVVIPVAFVILVLVPVLSKNLLFWATLFMIQIIYMAILSIGLPYPPKSKFYIISSSFFLILCSGFAAYDAFLPIFSSIHAVVSISIILFRTFLILGMLNRSKTVEDLS